LDEVTTKNGTVAFWRHSKLIWPVDPRHPERALVQAGLKSESLLGKEGTVHVWDSRLLHRSLANRTEKRRLALQWIVTSTGKNGVSLAVST
jgi:ectoine hydroxylase-related dioxygenase (phytanoyl-CoA dioxygenase family)